jgi:DNA-directed RNA polymerase specialized sigma24 family protein
MSEAFGTLHTERERRQVRHQQLGLPAAVWPENLYCAVFSVAEYKDIPVGWENAIEAVLSDLPEPERVLLLEHYCDGVTVAELARNVNVTYNSIRRKVTHVKRKLRHPKFAKRLLHGLKES